jgi:hypothetical protein
VLAELRVHVTGVGHTSLSSASIRSGDERFEKRSIHKCHGHGKHPAYSVGTCDVPIIGLPATSVYACARLQQEHACAGVGACVRPSTPPPTSPCSLGRHVSVATERPRPCWPRPCWPRPCWPRPCWLGLCWLRPCWPRPCWLRPCWPRPCWLRPCWLGPCWLRLCWRCAAGFALCGSALLALPTLWVGG